MLNDKSEPDSPPNTSSSADPQSVEGQPIPPTTSRRPVFPFHPLLIAAFPILSLYARNMDEVPLREIWRPLGLSLLGCMGVWALVAALSRHVRKGALAASILTIVFFSYGHLTNLLPPQPRDMVAPLGLTGLVAMLFILFRSRSQLVHATIILNFTAAVLLVPACLTMGSHLFARGLGMDKAATARRNLIYRRGSATSESEVHPANVHRPKPLSPSEAARLPDIYYIILDAYGRADSLKTFYGYDNTPFVHALEARGFYVAPRSRSNYDQTGYCLPTYLNMNYLNVLFHGPVQADDIFETQRRLIDENAVADFLRNQGYHFVYIWTGTAVTQIFTADLELDEDALTPPSSFEGQVFSLSALDATPNTPQMTNFMAANYDRHRTYIQTAFHNLDVVANLPYPKFVFAHILAPHPPFVFGPNGEAVNPRYPYNDDDGSRLLARINRQTYKTGYIGQLQYINGRVLEAVDAIKRQSKQPPIIIIQGDHGSRMNLDWDSLAKTDVREPFSILNAYLVPSRVREHLYDTITPVNSFRILLSFQFGANYPLLPDRNFFSTVDRTLEFTDVTDLLDQAWNKMPSDAHVTVPIPAAPGVPTTDYAEPAHLSPAHPASAPQLR